MPLEPFKPSAPLTLGVELELQLVNPADLDLTAGAPDLLELLGRAQFPGDVKPEITASMIEISTGIHSRHDALLGQLRAARDALVAAGDRLNVGICGGGTHPFQRWNERRIFPRPRYQRLHELYGYLAKQFTVFGQHVHVGVPSGDDALFLLHALNRYLPHFIALAASSPFLQGVDTLFDSARLNSIFAFPLSGRAPFTLRWSEFEEGYFARMARTGVVASMKDFYWDVRPKPEFGTIELRVCDTPLTVERAAALAAYLQALSRMLLAREEPDPVEDDYLVYNFNRFQACRFGLDGLLVHPRTYERVPIRDDLVATLRRIEPHAAALGADAALAELAGAVGGGNDAQLLRAQVGAGGEVQSAVEFAVRRFREARAAPRGGGGQTAS